MIAQAMQRRIRLHESCRKSTRIQKNVSETSSVKRRVEERMKEFEIELRKKIANRTSPI